MKWHSTTEYPFYLAGEDEDRELRKAAYKYFINHMGFDKWTYYEPVKDLSKLLHGDRSYNAGRAPKASGVSYYPWLDHARYFRDTHRKNTVLVTQPYPYGNSLVTTKGLNMEDLTTLKMYSKAFSFYWPETTEIHLITSKEAAKLYEIIITQIHEELFRAFCVEAVRQLDEA